MKAETPEQLVFDLPLEAHPGAVLRRVQRERIRAEGEDAERAALSVRHRQEWDDHLDLWNDALLRRSLPLALLAKELAQTLKIRQAEERLAWSKPEQTDPDETALWGEVKATLEQHPEIAQQLQKALSELRHETRRKGRRQRHSDGAQPRHESA